MQFYATIAGSIWKNCAATNEWKVCLLFVGSMRGSISRGPSAFPAAPPEHITDCITLSESQHTRWLGSGYRSLRLISPTFCPTNNCRKTVHWAQFIRSCDRFRFRLIRTAVIHREHVCFE